MFCSIYFRPINHLPAGEGVANETGEGVANETGKGVANARRKQSNSAQPFSWALRPAAKTTPDYGKQSGVVFTTGGSNSKMVAPHLMCSRIFFR